MDKNIIKYLLIATVALLLFISAYLIYSVVTKPKISRITAQGLMESQIKFSKEGSPHYWAYDRGTLTAYQGQGNNSRKLFDLVGASNLINYVLLGDGKIVFTVEVGFENTEDGLEPIEANTQATYLFNGKLTRIKGFEGGYEAIDDTRLLLFTPTQGEILGYFSTVDPTSPEKTTKLVEFDAQGSDITPIGGDKFLITNYSYESGDSSNISYVLDIKTKKITELVTKEYFSGFLKTPNNVYLITQQDGGYDYYLVNVPDRSIKIVEGLSVDPLYLFNKGDDLYALKGISGNVTLSEVYPEKKEIYSSFGSQLKAPVLPSIFGNSVYVIDGADLIRVDLGYQLK